MEARRDRSDGIEFLGADGPAHLDHTTVTRRPRPPGWLLAVAAVVVVGVALLTLRGGSDPEGTADETAETTDETAETPETVEGDDAIVEAPSTTVPPDDRPVVVVDGAGPLLGEEVDLALVTTTPTGITVVDLDSGTEVHIDESFHALSAVVDGWLLGVYINTTKALDLRSGTVVDLSAISGMPSLYPSDRAAPTGHAWLHSGAGVGSMVLVELATGLVVETADLPTGWAFSGFGSVGTPIAGGVYELTADGPRRLFDGGLITATGDALLVQRCDDELACEIEWVDRDGAPLPGFVAPDPESFDWIGGTSSERWVVAQSWRDEEFSMWLFDTSSGDEVELAVEYYDGNVPVSPDGRWLALSIGATLTVTDLDAGVDYELPTRGSGALFIDDADIVAALFADAGVEGG